jgi:hypothetical protein
VSTVVPPADGLASGNEPTSEIPIAAVNPTPSDVSPVGSDIGFATQSDYVATGTAGVSITDRFTKRASFTIDGQLTESQVVGQARVESRIAHGQVGYKLTRKMGVHVGYGIQDVRYVQESTPNSRLQNHFVDFGIDYGDGHSFSFARYHAVPGAYFVASSAAAAGRPCN